MTEPQNAKVPQRSALEGGCLLLISPLSGLAQAGLSPILPKITEHFAAEPNAGSLVRMLVSSVVFAMILGSVGGGIVAQRFGQRRTLLIALAGYAIAGSVGFFLETLPLLLASRLALGVFNAAASTVGITILTTRLAGDRDRWLGYNHMTGTFAAIAILLLAGWIGSTNWRGVFLLHLIALPVLLAIWTFVPDAPVDQSSAETSTKRRIPGGVMLIGLAIGAIAATSTVFVPFHLSAIGAGDPRKVASAILPTAIMGGIVAFTYGWLRQRWSVAALFVAGFTGTAIGTIICVLTGSYVGTIVGMAIFGGSVGLTGPGMFAAAANAVPAAQRAATMGLVRAASYVGPLLAQLCLDPLTARYGADAALVGLALLGVGMAVIISLKARTLVPANG